MLVLPGRMELLSRGWQHLLRRHPYCDESGALHPWCKPVCGRQPVRHRTGSGRARRRDGDSQYRRREDGSGRGFLCGTGGRHHADDGARAGRPPDDRASSVDMGRCTLLLREEPGSCGLGFRVGQRRLGCKDHERHRRGHQDCGQRRGPDASAAPRGRGCGAWSCHECRGGCTRG